MRDQARCELDVKLIGRIVRWSEVLRERLQRRVQAHVHRQVVAIDVREGQVRRTEVRRAHRTLDGDLLGARDVAPLVIDLHRGRRGVEQLGKERLGARPALRGRVGARSNSVQPRQRTGVERQRHCLARRRRPGGLTPCRPIRHRRTTHHHRQRDQTAPPHHARHVGNPTSACSTKPQEKRRRTGAQSDNSRPVEMRQGARTGVDLRWSLNSAPRAASASGTRADEHPTAPRDAFQQTTSQLPGTWPTPRTSHPTSTSPNNRPRGRLETEATVMAKGSITLPSRTQRAWLLPIVIGIVVVVVTALAAWARACAHQRQSPAAVLPRTSRLRSQASRRLFPTPPRSTSPCSSSRATSNPSTVATPPAPSPHSPLTPPSSLRAVNPLASAPLSSGRRWRTRSQRTPSSPSRIREWKATPSSPTSASPHQSFPAMSNASSARPPPWSATKRSSY